MMNRVLPFLLLALLLSCEKIIDVELRDAPPQLVIEAAITDQPGPYYVRLSQSVNFREPNSFPAVTNAKVIISDNLGNEDVLNEVLPGLYQSDSIKGVPGRSYKLTVVAQEKEYVATSTMPLPVMVTDITIEEGGFIGETENEVVVWFQDAAGITNHYRFVAWKNELPFNRSYVFEDKGYDGRYLRYSIEPDENNDALKIASRDRITVEMQGLDPNAYLYFLTLSQHTGEGPQTAPANPISNITGSALGYFSAHSTSKISVIVEK